MAFWIPAAMLFGAVMFIIWLPRLIWLAVKLILVFAVFAFFVYVFGNVWHFVAHFSLGDWTPYWYIPFLIVSALVIMFLSAMVKPQ